MLSTRFFQSVFAVGVLIWISITYFPQEAGASYISNGSSPTGAAGGALTGTYPNPTILNLTTVGAVPYVSATGTLNQDQTAAHQFFWDATNHRLGIGTATPSTDLHINAASASNGFTFSRSASNSGIITMRNTGANFIESTSAQLIVGTVAADDFFLRGNSVNVITIRGSSTNAVGIGKENTSPTGTLHIKDTTAATGATLVTIAKGAADTVSNVTFTSDARSKSQGGSQITPVAVASLPTCNAGAEGTRLGVTDALAPTFLVAVVGGGAAHTPVYCDGTNWIAF